MPLYLVVHHRRDPDQPWVNGWLDDDCLEAIQTTRQVADLCNDALGKDHTVFVHRCAFASNVPTICCSLKIDAVDKIVSSTWLVKFKDQTPQSLFPPTQPARGQNWYVV
jgi:hypothetical protein